MAAAAPPRPMRISDISIPTPSRSITSDNGTDTTTDINISSDTSFDFSSPGIENRQRKKLSILNGVVAYVEVRSNTENRSKAVMRELEYLGATVEHKFTNEVTHVIFKDGKKSTQDKAIKKGVHIVNVLWIEGCKNKQERISETDYTVPHENVITPPIFGTKVRKARSMQPRDFDEALAHSAERNEKKRKRQEAKDKKFQFLLASPLLVKTREKSVVYALETQEMSPLSPVSATKYDSPTVVIPESPYSDDNNTPINLLEHEETTKDGTEKVKESLTPLQKRLFDNLRRKKGPGSPRANTILSLAKPGSRKRKLLNIREPLSPMQSLFVPQPKSSITVGQAINNKKAEAVSRKRKNDVLGISAGTDNNSVQNHHHKKLRSGTAMEVDSSEVLYDMRLQKGKHEKEPRSDTDSTVLPNDTVSTGTSSNESDIENIVGTFLSLPSLDAHKVLPGIKPLSEARIGVPHVASNRRRSMRIPHKSLAAVDETSQLTSASEVKLTPSKINSPKAKSKNTRRRSVQPSSAVKEQTDGKLKSTKHMNTCIESGSEEVKINPGPIQPQRRRHSVLGVLPKSRPSIEEFHSPPSSRNLTKCLKKLKITPKQNSMTEWSALSSSDSESNHNSSSGLTSTKVDNIKRRVKKKGNITITNKGTSQRSQKANKDSSTDSTSNCHPGKKNDHKRSLSMTSLHNSERDLVRSITKTLGGFLIVDSPNNTTSHVVCGGPRRTLNVLKAIARGCWILSLEWVLKSLEVGHWLDEEPYEINDYFPSAQVSRLERYTAKFEYKQQLFADAGIVFVSKLCSPPHGELTELLELCGAEVTICARKSALCVGPTNQPNTPSVTELWVLDSITEHRMLPVDHYLVDEREGSPAL